ncbi:MAG: AEC family transporter [Lachnospiraceae bacterium]|nr:AEC family transporter [Lachnospiraceae bacterium]
MVIDSIKSVFSLMMLIGLGFYFTGKKWFGKPGMDFLSKFTIQVSVPFYMFYNIYKDVGTRENLFDLIRKLPVTFGVTLLCILVGAIVAKLFRVDPKRKNTFIVASAFPNVVFIGFPVIQALWGDGITSIGVIFYIANTMTFWTLGIWFLQRGKNLENNGKNQFVENLKKMLNPPIMGMLLGIVAVFFALPIPDFVEKPLSMISSVTSPLALIFIGSVIRNMDRSSMKFGRDIFAALATRFIFIPIVSIAFLRMMPIPIEMKQVFFMISTMPAMTQMGIMARQYDSDYEFACTVITMTTIISMLTIPVFMFIMQTFNVFG